MSTADAFENPFSLLTWKLAAIKFYWHLSELRTKTSTRGGGAHYHVVSITNKRNLIQTETINLTNNTCRLHLEWEIKIGNHFRPPITTSCAPTVFEER